MRDKSLEKHNVPVCGFRLKIGEYIWIPCCWLWLLWVNSKAQEKNRNIEPWKTTANHFRHMSLDSSSYLGIHVRGWVQMPVVWWKDISEMFGDMWDRGVKMDVKKYLENSGCFQKRNIDLKSVEKCSQISSICVDGVREE